MAEKMNDDNTVVVTTNEGIVQLLFDGCNPISKGEHAEYEQLDGLTNVRNKNRKIPRGKQMRDLLTCVGGTLNFNGKEYKIKLDCQQQNKEQQPLEREDVPSGDQKTTPREIVTFDDLVLQRIIEFLPDPETACRFGASCSLLRSMVQNERNVIWDRFLQNIPLPARPKYNPEYVESEPTNQEVVLRFTSGCLFASRMERLAPRHRVFLGEGNYCQGCTAFPDATGYTENSEFAEHKRGDVFFVRYSVKESLVWQGFLSSSMCSNGDIYLDLGHDNVDLSQEFDWPEMKAMLEYNRQVQRHPQSEEWVEEKHRMKIEMYKHLTLTIVMIKDNIADQKLCICTSGPDIHGIGPFGYCCGPHMEIMPVLSHGISPVKPVEEGWNPHPYFRTSQEERHYSGDFVAVGHFYRWDYKSNCEKYIGPVFAAFSSQDTYDGLPIHLI